MIKKTGRIPERIREEILIEYDYSCCICGHRYFVDVHHIKPRHEGGGHESFNLVVLCPTCHRAADRGVYSRRVLRRYGDEHIKQVKQVVSNKTHLGKIQEEQIWRFIYHHCISTIYPRQEFLKLDQNELYFIAFDLARVGIVVDPTDGKPVLISEDEIIELTSLEVITNPFRMMFLEEWQSAKERLYSQSYLVRIDVAKSISPAAKKRGRVDEGDSIIRKYRKDTRKLIGQEAMSNRKK